MNWTIIIIETATLAMVFTAAIMIPQALLVRPIGADSFLLASPA